MNALILAMAISQPSGIWDCCRVETDSVWVVCSVAERHPKEVEQPQAVDCASGQCARPAGSRPSSQPSRRRLFRRR